MQRTGLWFCTGDACKYLHSSTDQVPDPDATFFVAETKSTPSVTSTSFC